MNPNSLTLIWEIPLAFASFCLYKTLKFIIGNLYTIFLTFNHKKAFQWRILSEELVNSFLSLPVLMTKAPRWNTHAIIGTLGPIKVKQSLGINRQIADNSTQSWIAVIYSFPEYETITTLKSSSTNLQNWLYLNLKSGLYTLGVRYYEYYDQINFPEVKIDETVMIPSQNIPANVNDFYQQLHLKSNGFYLALHYYIYTILRWRNLLPESWIKSEFLPVGAPDTEFIYDYLQQGEILSIHIESLILTHYYVYFTLYNRASFPRKSLTINQENTNLEPAISNGFYLLRLRPKQEDNNEHSIITSLERNDSEKIQLSIRMK